MTKIERFNRDVFAACGDMKRTVATPNMYNPLNAQLTTVILPSSNVVGAPATSVMRLAAPDTYPAVLGRNAARAKSIRRSRNCRPAWSESERRYATTTIQQNAPTAAAPASKRFKLSVLENMVPQSQDSRATNRRSCSVTLTRPRASLRDEQALGRDASPRSLPEHGHCEAHIRGQVPPAKPTRLMNEPMEPLETGFLHPHRRTRLRTANEVERGTDSERYGRGQSGSPTPHPQLLARGAQSAPDDVRPCFGDL